ncbi:hypothetical protein ETR37_11940 [Geobacillus sp. PK12]|nr:hypothetical protein ETR37_11940 [Geobacillus sp. PK12]
MEHKEERWAAAFYIDATKEFHISLTEKRFVHFRLSKASHRLASVTPWRDGRPNNRLPPLDPYMGLEAALFGPPTVDQILGKRCKWQSFELHLYSSCLVYSCPLLHTLY